MILKLFSYLGTSLVIMVFSFSALAADNLQKAFNTGSNEILGKTAEGAGYSQNQYPLTERINDIITIFLSFLGVIFIVLMIYAGYLWMTAAGEEKKVETAQSIIKTAVIGIVVIISAYAISYFVINALTEKTLQ